MLSSRSSAVVAATLALVIAGIATTAFGRNAPDPLPAYSSLERETWVVLHSVSDEIGTFHMYGGHEYYVWDIALAKLPNGQVRFLRLEVQRDDGLYFIHSGSLSDWPDAVEVTDLDEANGSDWVEFADDYGRPDFVHPSAIGQGAIGQDGTTIVNPGLIDRGGCKGKN